ncbi:MAG: hypothetical protein M3327_16045 [Actinomycetota bacterium]|nr:hypothetical protein [Actinomycetota bacterium]
MSSLLRRLAVPASLAAIRLRHRIDRALLVAGGIAAGAAALGLVLGGALVAEDRSASRTFHELPAGERVIHVAHFGIPTAGESHESLDSSARRALAGVSPSRPIRVVAYKLLRIDAAPVRLAGIDDASRWVRLDHGRYPETCTPRRCEVVRIEGRGRVPSARGIRLVVVGSGKLSSALPFARFVEGAGAVTGETPRVREQPPFVLASGTSPVASLPALAAIYRSYGWIVPVTREVHPWEIDDFLSSVRRLEATLRGESEGFDVTAPVQELSAASHAAGVASTRLLLIGGQAAALLLAFAVLAAVALRPDVEATTRRLVSFGARRSQLLVLSAVETAALALVGTAVGWGLAAVGVGLVAEEAGSPPRAIVTHSLVSEPGAVAAVAVAFVAAGVLLVALRAPALELRGLSVSAADVAALGAIVAIAVAFMRGNVDAASIASEGGTGAILLLLPGLAALVAAVACARALTPALRVLGRLGERGGVSVRIAALSLARHPGRGVVAVTFVVVSVALGVFAIVYHATLSAGLDSHVDYEFPADFLISENLAPDALVPPLAAAPLARYRDVGASVRPIVRRSGSVSTLARTEQLTFLGVPARGLAGIAGWRDDFADVGLDELARRIAPPGPVRLQGPLLPPDAVRLQVPFDERSGDDVTLTADLLTAKGRFVELRLGTLSGRTGVLSPRVPAGLRGARILGVTFGRVLGVEGHAQGNVPVLSGLVRLERMRSVRRSGRAVPVGRYDDWIEVDARYARMKAGAAVVAYNVTSETGTRLRPRQPVDAKPLPVIASPAVAALAGSDGIVRLRLISVVVETKVVGVAKAFPSLSDDFLVADTSLLSTALNSDVPGTGMPNEIWLSAPPDRVPDVARALARPPFAVLAVRSKAAYAEAVRDDPLARGSLVTTAAAAVVALALSVVGLVLLLFADLRDDRSELFDLEAQGAAPAALRRHLRLRVFLVASVGIAGGLLAGLVLSALVVDLVTLTAAVAAAEPPLLLRIEWSQLALALAAYVALVALVVALVTANAFRRALPERAAAV